jgi:tetratricopeptide (TPR) repeat protein
VDAPKLIEKEPRFSVPQSTALAVTDVADDLVPDHQRLLATVREFGKRAASAASSGARRKIGNVVSQTIALMTAGQFDKAIETVEAALASAPNNPDLLLLKARCLTKLDAGKATEVYAAAFKSGQRKPLLFDLWYRTLSERGDFVTAVDVANLALDGGLDRPHWLPLRARANVNIGAMRYREGSAETAIELFQKAADDLSQTLSRYSTGRDVVTLLSDLRAVHDAAWKVARKGSGLDANLVAFDVARAALDRRDYRPETVERLLAATLQLVTGLDLNSESGAARAGRTRVTDALKTLRAAQDGSSDTAAHAAALQDAISKLDELGR